MKKILLLFLSLPYFSQAQSQTLDWINANAIVIEDTRPDGELKAFKEKAPLKFKNARVFGFGEASHHGKEFFDLKAKFFKYLVENQGVTVFIMEESYQAEHNINTWISGGEGSRQTVENSLVQGIWRCNEILDLFQWMRDYNMGKPREKQIRFYGMDNQLGMIINQRLRTYLKKNNIVADEQLLSSVDSCSNAYLKAGGVKNWSDTYLPDLIKVKQLLTNNESRLIASNEMEYLDMQRAMDYLKQYTVFVQAPYSHARDKDMYENVLTILELEGKNSKAFVWAHNQHIKKEYETRGFKRLGTLLKEHFMDRYYAVGFDFGKGLLKGYLFEKGKPATSVYRTLTEPYKKTFAETLIQATPDNYFIDMQQALDTDKTKFFEAKKDQLFLGGPGYNPEKPDFIKMKYTEAFDGIIFVKNITPATY